jgi:DNA-directed RNA polymerase specialized sigma24 family protein
MEEFVTLIRSAQNGNAEAYSQLVRRFQDMAYGYAYAILGDFHLAEDAAQEALIEAYRCLPGLQEPLAFPL